MILRLDHLVLTVRDVERSCAFYVEVLGMTRVAHGGGRVAVRFGAQKIKLHPRGSSFPPVAKSPLPGTADLCLLVDRPVERIMDRLRQAGVGVLEGPIEKVGAVGPMVSIYVRDPDGNLIELSTPVGSGSGNAPSKGLIPLQVPSAGVLLLGVLFPATGPGPHPTVVMLHGFPGTENNFDLAHALRRSGRNVLTFHYRGAWGSPGRFTFSNALEDAEAALGHVVSRLNDRSVLLGAGACDDVAPPLLHHDPLVRAFHRSGHGSFDTLELPGDHGFLDHREKLARELIRWHDRVDALAGR